MRQLVWNDELAEIAQRYSNRLLRLRGQRNEIGSGYAWTKYKAILIFRFVDQCVFGHDKNRRVERFYVGQNYAVLWGSIMKNGKRVSLKNMDIGESGAAMTQNWYDEVSNIAKIFRHPSKIL